MRLLRINYWKCLTNNLKPRKILNQRIQFCATSTGVNSSEWQKPDTIDAFDTGITVYNCVHRGYVPFIIRNASYMTWYTCGPTVYDDAHIGHAICYMKCDIIQRILRNHFNLNVITAMNITDIDDKIVARASILNRSVTEVAQQYEQSFWHDMNALGIQRADIIVRVTEFIPQIIAFIEKLLANRDAYVAADGSVYYANRRTNGKLKNLESSTKAAVTSDTHTKLDATSISVRRSANDFALWKATAKPNEQPQWNVPWKYDDNNNNILTAGRPGWHTECSAMATKLFGNTIDVHAGGIDLKFPHHENEEAQCCSYHNRKQWVNYWLHIGHLVTTDNVKMSKSLKNTISINEFLRHYSRDQLRMACLISTYHQHIEFSDDILLTTGDLLKRFISFFDDTERFLHSNHKQNSNISNQNEILAAIHATTEKIDSALKDDFDTRSCIGSLNDLITLINKSINPQHLKQQNQTNGETGSGMDVIKCGQNVVRKFLDMVGLHDTIDSAFAHQNTSEHKVTATASSSSSASIPIENLINDILSYRTKTLSDAKLNKDKKLFEICDHLRSIMRQNGLAVKDFEGQSTWKFDNVVTRKNQTKK